MADKSQASGWVMLDGNLHELAGTRAMSSKLCKPARTGCGTSTTSHLSTLKHLTNGGNAHHHRVFSC